MKPILKALLMFFSISAFAQIGVNTTTPNGMLDVTSTTNGVLISRIVLTANNVAAPVVNPQGGALAISTLIYNTATVAGVNGVSPGYYYWNGSLWISLTGSLSNDWKLQGNAAILSPTTPLTYGTSSIGATENFVGTTDANDVVVGTNNKERLRVKQSTGNIGIGTANPNYTFHAVNNQAGFTTAFLENTFVGNTDGIGIEGKATNNPGYGIGGRFTGNSIGVKGVNTGSTGNTTFGGSFTSDGAASTGTRYGIEGIAQNGSANFGGSFLSSGNSTSSNTAVVGNAQNGLTNIGGQFSSTGNAGSSNSGGFFAVFGSGTNNYGLQSFAQSTGINYAGSFSASGGTKNYALVVPSGGGTIGFGTITPNAMLDITSTINGVLISRIALTANNVATPVVNPQGGALTVSTLIYNTTTVVGVNGVSPGYYYWNGSIWIPLTPTPSNDWKLNGNAAVISPATPATYGTSTIGAAENFVGTTDANDVVVGTNNIERLRVKQTTGNVGIGTAIPNSKLDLNGDLALREGAAIAVLAGVNAVLLTGEFSHYRLTGAVGAFSINTISSGNDGQLITLINATATIMTVANNNVANGIITGTGTNLVSTGTSNSSVTLLYNATLARWVVTSKSGLDNANLWSLQGNTAITTPATPVTYGTSTIAATENFVGTTDANDVVIGTNTKERLRVKQTTGNVGIGTSNPLSKVEVYSNDDTKSTLYAENISVGSSSSNIAVRGKAMNGSNATGGYFQGKSIGISAFGTSDPSGDSIGATLFSSNSNQAQDIGNRTGVFTGASYGSFNVGISSGASGNFNCTNYGGRFITNTTSTTGTTNYGGYFSSTGGNKNYAIVVPPASGTIGFGTIIPSALLDVDSSTNGILIPRIVLTANNVAAPVVNPQGGALPISTLIYNTATVAGINGVSLGYYYWDGIKWIGFSGKNSKDWSLQGNTAITTPAIPITYGTSTIGATENFVGTLEANDVVIGTNNIERFRIKQSSGNVGIGTANPTTKLDILASGNTLGLQLLSGNNAQYSYLSLGKATEYAQIGACTDATFFSDAINGDMAIKNFNSGKILLGASFIAPSAMSIIPGGNVGIGTVVPNEQLEVANFVRSRGYRCRTGNSGVYGGNTFNVNWSGATAQLWIDVTNVGTFQFTSDRRLKENITTMNDNALTRVMQLKPVSFNYKNIPNTIFKGSDVVTEGFIADELQQIIPSAVNGKKDALTSEGTIQPQTLNMPPIVSVLTKAIQEQQAIIDSQNAKIKTLEERLKVIEEKLSK